jgi:Cys-tRNA(Pro)/Cys-tRNA(Cys) deacylase
VTPAIRYLQKRKIPFSVHKYVLDRSASSYGLDAARALNIPANEVFKTLVISLKNNHFVVTVIPVSEKLCLKSIAKAAGSKTAEMADGAIVERMTGYVLGGVSPLGQKRRLATVIDVSAKDKHKIYISGGKRGLEIEIAPLELGECLLARFENITA